MKSDDSKEFELDEPAAKSHTPPGWQIQTIEIVPSGKAPKKYGLTTYRFGAVLTLSVILPRRGWTLVKKAKNYADLLPALGPSIRLPRALRVCIRLILLNGVIEESRQRAHTPI